MKQTVLAGAPSGKPERPRRRDGLYYLDGNRALVEAELGRRLRHEKFDSVTKVNGDTIQKQALLYYMGKTAAELIFEDPWKYDSVESVMVAVREKKESAADRGKAIHSLMEAISRGATPNLDGVPGQYRGYAEAFLKFARTIEGFPVLFTEGNIYNDQHGYAGTFDLIVTDPKVGANIIYDFKTNKTASVYFEASIQLAAYKHGEFILTRDTPPRVVPMPRIDIMNAIGLGPDGNWTPRTCTHELEDFLAVLRTYRNLKKWGG